MCGGFGGLDQYGISTTPPTPTGDELPMLGGGLLFGGGRNEFGVPDGMPGDYNNPDKIDAPDFPTMRGSGGITPYLQGIIALAKNKEFNDIDTKAGPYFEEVQQITDRTFPDLFGGSSMGGGRLGALGGLQLQEAYGNMLANNQTLERDPSIRPPNEDIRPNTPQNYSNISQALGSRAKMRSGSYKMS